MTSTENPNPKNPKNPPIHTWEEGRARYLQLNRRFPLWFAKLSSETPPSLEPTGMITLGHLLDLPPEGREELFRLHGKGKPEQLRELVVAWLQAVWREGDEDPRTMPPPLLDLIANGTYALKRTQLLSVLAGSDFWLPERFHPRQDPPDSDGEKEGGEGKSVKKVVRIARGLP
jgi:hypothetical protein